jgi:hypothetical protein
MNNILKNGRPASLQLVSVPGLPGVEYAVEVVAYKHKPVKHQQRVFRKRVINSEKNSNELFQTQGS